MPLFHVARRAAALTCALLAVTAPALSLAPSGTAQVEGHAAGTFDTLAGPAGFSGGLAWGPDGTAYTHDGARVLYRWDVRTGRPVSRRVVAPPGGLPGAREAYGPRIRLEGFRADGGALRGPYFHVTGHRGPQPYQTGFTLRADGRAVLGEVCARASGRPGGCANLYSASVVARQGGRATVRLEGRGRRAADLLLPAGTVLDAEPSPDGERVAALRGADGGRFNPQAPLFLDVVTRAGRVVSRQVPAAFGVQGREEPQVRWVDAGRLLTAVPEPTSRAYSATGQRVALWTLGGPAPRWQVGGGELRDAVPSPDGALFLTVRGGSVPEVRRVSDGAFVRALGAAVTASAPLPQGGALLALDTGNGQGELRAVRSGGQGRRLGGPALAGVTALVVSPGGRFLAAARPGSVAVLDPAGRTLHTLALPGDAYRVALGFAGPRTLFAQFEDEGGLRTRVWDAGTGRLLSQAPDLRPLPGGLAVRAETRRRPSGVFESRLGGLDAGGRPLWQEAWRPEYRPLFLPSPDGRALVRLQGRPVPGQPEQVSAYVSRLDPRTGRASPGVTLRTGDPREAYRGLSLLDFAPDRRHALLREGAGDGCGGSFYGLRLADLGARREVTLPAALTSGLVRHFGCGQPLPVPTAAFTPDGGGLLVRDGNRLAWWSGDFGADR